MVFSSFPFLFVFLPAVLFVYYAVLRRRSARNLFLFLASLCFYAYGEPWFVFVMIASIAGNWLFGLAVERYREERVKQRLFLAVMLVFNLGIIFVFKYLMFVLNNINYMFGSHIPVPRILLPIGISFFTFQAISYVVDVYRGEVKTKEGDAVLCPAQRNPINVGLYIAFFPQLIAGPIVRYSTIAEQIRDRKENFDDFAAGGCRFIFGLSKKVLIANNLALAADYAFGTGQISAATAWLGSIAYTLQIYYDFSGYSDMAIGLGKMFGFRFLENFNYPYISRSITEFWRRWHISLGTWFRDYVYFPLGGSRVASKARLVFNLFAVWTLTGVWHGANWTFIVWGLLFFALLTLEKLTGFVNRLKYGLDLIYTLFFVNMSMTIFRSANLGQAVSYVKTMFGVAGVPLYDDPFFFLMHEYRWFFLFALIFAMPVVPWFRRRFSRENGVTVFCYVAMMAVLLATSAAYVIKGAYNPFIYFNF
ncbi:MAG: MBOAT family protein [Thermoguttaceae bacterium]|nr:MBOAT family protein [Thermoguttaceae bacterium]